MAFEQSQCLNSEPAQHSMARKYYHMNMRTGIVIGGFPRIASKGIPLTGLSQHFLRSPVCFMKSKINAIVSVTSSGLLSDPKSPTKSNSWTAASPAVLLSISNKDSAPCSSKTEAAATFCVVLSLCRDSRVTANAGGSRLAPASLGCQGPTLSVS